MKPQAVLLFFLLFATCAARSTSHSSPTPHSSPTQAPANLNSHAAITPALSNVTSTLTANSNASTLDANSFIRFPRQAFENLFIYHQLIEFTDLAGSQYYEVNITKEAKWAIQKNLFILIDVTSNKPIGFKFSKCNNQVLQSWNVTNKDYYLSGYWLHYLAELEDNSCLYENYELSLLVNSTLNATGTIKIELAYPVHTQKREEEHGLDNQTVPIKQHIEQIALHHPALHGLVLTALNESSGRDLVMTVTQTKYTRYPIDIWFTKCNLTAVGYYVLHNVSITLSPEVLHHILRMEDTYCSTDRMEKTFDFQIYSTQRVIGDVKFYLNNAPISKENSDWELTKSGLFCLAILLSVGVVIGICHFVVRAVQKRKARKMGDSSPSPNTNGTVSTAETNDVAEGKEEDEEENVVVNWTKQTVRYSKMK